MVLPVTLNAIAAQHPIGALGAQQSRPEKQVVTSPPKRQLFPAMSAIDDAKKKAGAVSNEAAREFETASQKAQSKTGKIEPWSAKYYAACITGGTLACVSNQVYPAVSTTAY